MDILKIYAQALAEFKAGNYQKALSIQAKLKKIAPTWTKNLLLEAYIYRAQNLHEKEISAIEKFLPKINLSEPAEKNLAAVAYSLLAATYRIIGNPKKAVKFFIKSAELESDFKRSCVEISNAIFAANDDENFSADDFQKLYALYQNKISAIKTFPQKIYNHDKIKIGYLSADFHEHPVTTFAWSLLGEHDKNNFEVYCYSAGGKKDWLTEKIIEAVDIFRDISNLSDFEAAEKIREDEIDILFDLSGHTSGNRLLTAAYRPATIQISGIGYMNSTGLNCFDYFLSDKFCKGDWEKYFVEKVIELPHSHFCYTPLKKFPEPSDAPCMKNKFVTFGVFNNYNKINDFMLQVWKKILDAVPNSRLIFKHQILGNAEGKKIVAERLKKFNFDLSRVELRGFTENYLDEYSEIDIALDTFPYTGGLTTCESIFSGVPVISLYGERHGTRFGLSILSNAGIGELACSTVEEYISRAVGLAQDFELLSILHKNLRQMMKNSPLMDFKNYVREVEEIFSEKLQTKKELGNVVNGDS